MKYKKLVHLCTQMYIQICSTYTNIKYKNVFISIKWCFNVLKKKKKNSQNDSNIIIFCLSFKDILLLFFMNKLFFKFFFQSQNSKYELKDF